MIPKLRNYCNGSFSPALQNNTIPLKNPSNADELGPMGKTSQSTLQECLKHAERSFYDLTWWSLGKRRAEYLEKIAVSLENISDELAFLDAINTGVLLSQTKILCKLIPHIFRAAAQQLLHFPDKESLQQGAQTVERWNKPLGPALCLGPWNAPALIGAHKIASALAAGCPCIIKPSEWTPYSTQRMIDLIAECDLPPGALQLVHGDSQEGAFLAAHSSIKAVSFTGGYTGGCSIATACIKRMVPMQLELGGHNPFIILEGADPSHAAQDIMKGLSLLNGQWCRAVGRIMVHESLRADLLIELKSHLHSLEIGPALAAKSKMGPVVHAAHQQLLKRKLSFLQKQGAEMIQAEAPQDQGCFFPLSIATNLPLEADHEEIFGPVASLHSFKDPKGMLQRINRDANSLIAYVYGPQDQAFQYARLLNIGEIKINGIGLTSVHSQSPRAAWGTSGFGAEGVFETFRFFRGTSLIGIPTSKL